MESTDEITIVVTSEDIDRGVAGSGTFCPIARAARRSLGIPETDVHLWVGQEHIIDLRPGKKRKDYHLPRSAQAFVIAFDRGDAVEPFTFTATLA